MIVIWSDRGLNFNRCSASPNSFGIHDLLVRRESDAASRRWQRDHLYRRHNCAKRQGVFESNRSGLDRHINLRPGERVAGLAPALKGIVWKVRACPSAFVGTWEGEWYFFRSIRKGQQQSVANKCEKPARLVLPRVRTGTEAQDPQDHRFALCDITLRMWQEREGCKRIKGCFS